MPISYPSYRLNALEFSGGSILTLGTITPGSGYADGVHPNVSLMGGAGKGAIATVTVSGGAVTAVVLTNPGGNVTSTGCVGYFPGDVLTITSTGGGTGFSIPVLTVNNSYQWQVPQGLSLILMDACGAGGGGGAGGPSTAGGGGGGSGASLIGFPVTVAPGAILILTPGLPGSAGVFNGNIATAGGDSIFSGTITPQPVLTGGLPGQPGVAGVGGTSGDGGGIYHGFGAAAGATPASPGTIMPGFYMGGSGGGGGGSTATPGAVGAGPGPYQGNSPGGGTGSGGGGAKTPWGKGGLGGNGIGGTNPTSAGSNVVSDGWGGGGAGGGPGFNGSAGHSGWFRLRF
jgi:hypothetical protein